KQIETDVRSCCLLEIRQTEEKYTATLESIEKVFTGKEMAVLSPAAAVPCALP
ncbi:hypothetical protein chiPu_0031202, partial [Chiloscyllium punctatum]|nr:hypothetical protein [Chiloscyllium punctatum]